MVAQPQPRCSPRHSWLFVINVLGTLDSKANQSLQKKGWLAGHAQRRNLQLSGEKVGSLIRRSLL